MHGQMSTGAWMAWSLQVCGAWVVGELAVQHVYPWGAVYS
jgi:hypothetical protein